LSTKLEEVLKLGKFNTAITDFWLFKSDVKCGRTFS
jgi:hypothetical protein